MIRSLVNTRAAQRNQAGATLLVALMMLLIITLLALSSLRGVSLESRITGNLKLQKTLTNAAEGALRMGEKSINLSKAPSVVTTCVSAAPATCMPWTKADLLPLTSNFDTPTRFGTGNANNVAKVTTNYDVQVQWYVVDLGNITVQASSQNNAFLTGSGPRYYEVNACASTVLCTSDTTTPRVMLRTVIARYYQ
jgi:type IV pilus assembly protein PilX